MIIDAGGGTVDLSTYKLTSVSPMSAEEIAPPDCKSAVTTTIPRLILYFTQVFFMGLHESTCVRWICSKVSKLPVHCRSFPHVL